MSAVWDHGFLLASLGDLAYLPRELIDKIIDFMDFNSVTRFTQVNRQAQLIIWSRVKYRFIRAFLIDKKFGSRYNLEDRGQTLLTTVTIQDLFDLVLTAESNVRKNCPEYVLHEQEDRNRWGDRNRWEVELVGGQLLCCHNLYMFHPTIINYRFGTIQPTLDRSKRLQLGREALTGQLVARDPIGISRKYIPVSDWQEVWVRYPMED
ncbi:hypothetical protein F4818DRAFT_443477 [Hypoxylon cercidicola]|nr:hypothetical protein F4818DRAFT_443477 [Hypoxylon cercidicola]